MKRPYQSPSLKVIEFRVELGYAASTPETLDHPLILGINSSTAMQPYDDETMGGTWGYSSGDLIDGEYF